MTNNLRYIINLNYFTKRKTDYNEKYITMVRTAAANYCLKLELIIV